jgi:hypothetical protein
LYGFSVACEGEDKFAVDCEGKLTFFAEASPESKINFSKRSLDGFSVACEGKDKFAVASEGKVEKLQISHFIFIHFFQFFYTLI